MKKRVSDAMIITNRIMLGLIMLIPGLIKLFVMKPDSVVGMLGGIGFPVAGFFGWLLMLSEVVFGILIIANWKVKYTVVPPIIILVVSAFTVHVGDPTRILLHLVVVSSYLVLGYSKK